MLFGWPTSVRALIIKMASAPGCTASARANSLRA